jgi:hypothetical protein
MSAMRLLPLLLLPALAGCAAAPPPEPARQTAWPSDCGIRLAVRLRTPRPGAEPLGSGDPVRACALPSADELAGICEVQDAAPIPGSSNPDDPEQPLHSFPDYAVRDAACRFVDPARTRARCRFTLAMPGEPPRRVEADLTYRFHDLSNAIAHDWWVTRWGTETVCRPG